MYMEEFLQDERIEGGNLASLRGFETHSLSCKC